MAKIWKYIEGYEGLYQVSNLGDVRSLDRTDSRGIYREGLILEHKIVKGYHLVGLSKDGDVEYKTVSRLVAKAFIPNPYNKCQVNHIDEDKSNNHKDNLEWVTPKENSNHGTRNERISKHIRNNRHKYEDSWERFREVTSKLGGQRKQPVVMMDVKNGEEIRTFNSIQEANIYLGKPKERTGINDALSGRSKTAYGYRWKRV